MPGKKKRLQCPAQDDTQSGLLAWSRQTISCLLGHVIWHFVLEKKSFCTGWMNGWGLLIDTGNDGILTDEIWFIASSPSLFFCQSIESAQWTCFEVSNYVSLHQNNVKMTSALWAAGLEGKLLGMHGDVLSCILEALFSSCLLNSGYFRGEEQRLLIVWGSLFLLRVLISSSRECTWRTNSLQVKAASYLRICVRTAHFLGTSPFCLSENTSTVLVRVPTSGKVVA